MPPAGRRLASADLGAVGVDGQHVPAAEVVAVVPVPVDAARRRRRRGPRSTSSSPFRSWSTRLARAHARGLHLMVSEHRLRLGHELPPGGVVAGVECAPRSAVVLQVAERRAPCRTTPGRSGLPWWPSACRTRSGRCRCCIRVVGVAGDVARGGDRHGAAPPACVVAEAWFDMADSPPPRTRSPCSGTAWTAGARCPSSSWRARSRLPSAARRRPDRRGTR